MLVKSLALRNIRSYNDGAETHLEFPEGVVLFEGDIGSGKSTLLYALEFALFGFSDMKGVHLLSEGRKEGGVSVTFESAETEYTIERRLRLKGDDVVQDECHMSTGGARLRLSPSDLKERVVSILGFNEPTHPRAESLVYRYAVFTPQEQMKEILVQSSEERLHVIRRVLGAQSYQVAAENSEIVERKVKERAYGLKKASEDIEEKKEQSKEKSHAIARLESDIPQLEAKEAASSELVGRLEAELEESRVKRESLGGTEAKIPLLKRQIDDYQQKVRDDDGRLQRLEEQLRDDVESTIKSFEARPRPASGARELDVKLGAERDKFAKLEAIKQRTEQDVEKTKDLLKKGVCPVCGQKIPKSFSTRTGHMGRELKELEESIAEASEFVSALEEQLAESRSYEEAAKDYARATKDRARVDREIVSLRRALRYSNASLSALRSELTKASSMIGAMNEVSDRIAELESSLKEARQHEREATLELNRARTQLADSERELGRLSEEVRKKQAALDEAWRLAKYQNWISSFFRPAVKLIENETLTLAAARFNEHFQRFFTSLVDDPDMLVKVKEDFSPVFEREGFEQDFEALSGGERTSMALAYRFALNTVVKESVTSRPELVILDEPTDGFSRDQVYKMRELLEELDARQVILVSHERELESMADHIFRVEKRNGTSTVVSA